MRHHQFVFVGEPGQVTEVAGVACRAARDHNDRPAAARTDPDRGASADERGHAEHDRVAALDDRGASAREREYSSVDGLTGVYLRSAGFVELDHEVDRARRSGAPLVLAFVDVDHLKDINDSRGHDAGDKTLLAVAKALAAQMRSYDLIFRYRGDEFVCALVGVTIEDVAKRLALANVALVLGPEHTSVTAGLADLRPGERADALVARADATLLRLRQQIRRPPEVTNP
ncbi:GGDEF domain-containing protein [Pengzhenrongella phosphoraccumulans]|uniref:GGDEF domain-containing protein n=1 Tax=Pengzhenrongella phosphoraccumulans TaxID=3114394 RepID=UPI00388E7A1A